jgi:hypothetical protein
MNTPQHNNWMNNCNRLDGTTMGQATKKEVKDLDRQLCACITGFQQAGPKASLKAIAISQDTPDRGTS